MSNAEGSDNASTFSNEEGQPFIFSLTKLEADISRQIAKLCCLRKLAEGGYHRVLGNQIYPDVR
jgi:hypothetical protein